MACRVGVAWSEARAKALVPLLGPLFMTATVGARERMRRGWLLVWRPW